MTGRKIEELEFYGVHFSHHAQETWEEKFISVPEQGGGKLIPDGPMNPGVLHVVATGSGRHLGLFLPGVALSLVDTGRRAP